MELTLIFIMVFTGGFILGALVSGMEVYNKRRFNDNGPPPPIELRPKPPPGPPLPHLNVKITGPDRPYGT